MSLGLEECKGIFTSGFMVGEENNTTFTVFNGTYMYFLIFYCMLILFSCESSHSPDDLGGIIITGNNSAITAEVVVLGEYSGDELNTVYLKKSGAEGYIDSVNITGNGIAQFDSLTVDWYDLLVSAEGTVVGQRDSIATFEDSTVVITFSVEYHQNIDIHTEGNGNTYTNQNGEENNNSTHNGDIVHNYGDTMAQNNSTTIIIEGDVNVVDTSGQALEEALDEITAESGVSSQAESIIHPSSQISIPVSSIAAQSSGSLPVVSLSSTALSSTHSSSSVWLSAMSSIVSSSSTEESSSSVAIASPMVSSSMVSSSSISSSSLIQDCLVDMQHSLLRADQDNYSLSYNITNEGKPIQLNGITYNKALWTYPHSEIVYDLNSEWDWFEVDVGIEDYQRDHDPQKSIHAVTSFMVTLDGLDKVVSPSMRFHSNTRRYRIDVSGVNTLTLSVNLTDTRFGVSFENYSIWGNPVLWKGDSLDYSNPYTIPISNEVYDFYYDDVKDEPNVGAGWTDCSMYTVNTHGFIMCMNNSNSDFLIRAIASDLSGSSLVGSGTFSETWTEFNTALIGGVYYLQLYNSANGAYALHAFENDGQPGTLLDTDTIATGISDFEFYSHEGADFVALVSDVREGVVIHSIGGDKSIGDTVVQSSVSGTWSDIVMYTTATGAYMLMNNADDVTQKTYAIGSDGSLASLVTQNQFDQGWDMVKPFRFNSKMYLFLYNDYNGAVRNFSLNDDGTIGRASYYRSWGSGWDTGDILEVQGEPVRFMVKSSSGRSVFTKEMIEEIAP